MGKIEIRLPGASWIFDPDAPIGEEGGFGAVFVGYGSDNKEVAVKRLKLSAADAAHRELKIADDLRDRPPRKCNCCSR